MTTADTPAPAEQPPTAPAPMPVPTPVRGVINALAVGWRYTVTHAEGMLDVTRTTGEEDGNGKTKRAVELLAVDSVALKACHPDGRGVVALWFRDPAARTPRGKAKGYGFDMAWRGRLGDELVPSALNLNEVKAFVSGADVPAALRGIDAVREAAAATAAKAAATRERNKAGKGADVVELQLTLEAEDVAA